MTDFKNNKYIQAILVWGIFSWAFLVYKFWVWIFRSQIFGHENPVVDNVGYNNLEFDYHKPAMLDWVLPKNVPEMDHEYLENHIDSLMSQIQEDGTVLAKARISYVDQDNLRTVVKKNRHGKGRSW